MTTILEDGRAAARLRILYLPHAVKQMARPERLIPTRDVEEMVFEGELIEDYPDVLGVSRCHYRLMECLHCKGRMERGTAPFAVDRHGYHVRWDDARFEGPVSGRARHFP